MTAPTARRGVVTAPLEKKIVEGANFDEVITIGPLIMMKIRRQDDEAHTTSRPLCR